VAEPPAVSELERWTLLPLEREDLLTGRGDTIAVERPSHDRDRVDNR